MHPPCAQEDSFMDESRPRQPHYRFAHRVLKDLALLRPAETWAALAGPGAADALRTMWETAGGTAAELPRVERVDASGGLERVVIVPPPAVAATEAHAIAIVRRPTAPEKLGYFVMERGLPSAGRERAFVAEYRADGARIRGDDLPAVALDAFLQRLDASLATRGADPFPAIAASLASLPRGAAAAPRGREEGPSAVPMLLAGLAMVAVGIGLSMSGIGRVFIGLIVVGAVTTLRGAAALVRA
jgi:hypothetical protein